MLTHMMTGSDFKWDFRFIYFPKRCWWYLCDVFKRMNYRNTPCDGVIYKAQQNRAANAAHVINHDVLQVTVLLTKIRLAG